MRTFEHFPEGMTCQICGTTEDKPCFLASIVGTEVGNNCEALPFHKDCLLTDGWQYEPKYKLLFKAL